MILFSVPFPKKKNPYETRYERKTLQGKVKTYVAINYNV